MAKVTIKGRSDRVAKLLSPQRTFYMHTLDGYPAEFYPKDGVCFKNKVVRLVSGLARLRREQVESKKLRFAKGLEDKSEYGNISVTLPNE